MVADAPRGTARRKHLLPILLPRDLPEVLILALRSRKLDRIPVVALYIMSRGGRQRCNSLDGDFYVVLLVSLTTWSLVPSVEEVPTIARTPSAFRPVRTTLSFLGSLVCCIPGIVPLARG